MCEVDVYKGPKREEVRRGDGPPIEGTCAGTPVGFPIRPPAFSVPSTLFFYIEQLEKNNQI